MKGITLLSLFGLIAIASATPAILQNAATQRADEKLAFRFEDVIPSRFSLRGFNGTWVTGNTFTMTNTENNVVLYTIGSTEEGTSITTLFSMSIFAPWPTMSRYTLSPDRSQVLIRYDVRNIFRHSIVARYAILTLGIGGATTTISNGEEIQVCLWSPTGNSIAYVKENDVYYINSANGVERRLTFNGVPGVIYNGVPDWVYEEEVFGTDYALWFSPDSSKMAIVSFDDTNVEQFTYHIYGEPGSLENQYPEDVTLRYPKSGTTNPIALLRVLDLGTLPADPLVEPGWRQIPAPVTQVGAEHIIGDIIWRTNDGLLVSWLNRRQNTLRMENCAFDTLACVEAFSATEPNGWIDVNTPKCYDDGNICYFLANLNGYKHVKGIVNGQLVDLTGGDYTVLSLNGYSVATEEVYFTANTIDNVHHRQVYKTGSGAAPNVCLSCVAISPEDEQCTYASAAFSTDYTLYTLTCTGPGPSYTRIYRTSDQSEVVSWEENLATRELFEGYIMPNIQYLKVPLTGGFEATVKLMLPPQIDFSATSFDARYPMIVNVYGGPGSDQVSDTFSIGFQHYLITSRNIIYCMIDGRGSSHSGTEQMFQVNNALGTVEIEDQITVTKYLQDNYGFIDAERTGIWGWSYGGYATAFALAKDDGNVFQGGISVAPVTSWIYYDTIYTERYMGTPQDNPEGYNAGDVNQHTELLRNHAYFLVHGNADDNVHYQQAMALSRVLQKESILFEQMSYPDEAHGLNGVSNHLYLTMDKFWTECLQLNYVSSATSLSASFLVLIVVTNILYFF